MFNFEEARPEGIFKFIGIGQQVSWKRSDGIHRFAAMRFGLPRRGVARTVQGDQTGEVAQLFFDGIRVALQETIAMEPLSIEPSTLVQFRFRSPDGRWVSTKLTPLGDGDIHSLVSGVLQNTLGSSPNFVVDKLEIFYTRPAQGAGGRATNPGVKGQLRVYSYGSQDNACGLRALALLCAHKDI